MRSRTVFALSLLFFLLAACEQRMNEKSETLFTLIEPAYSGVDFINQLSYSDEFNIYTYRNYYNGGGVALGDINNDGLLDIYLTGNQVPNRLYLNKGNFQFEDITEKAGVAGTQTWSTGVAMADVNGDGLIDIYVCNSGNIEGGKDKKNELFINQGDLTFREMAGTYGIADEGYSTHAAFFDYDRDGDLDLYILNNSYQAIGSFNLRKSERGKRDPFGGDKLMRNDGGQFTDVSEEANIYGSVIGFGLGVTIGDINKDGWLDIYVCNDFFERDYLYINNADGTFREELPAQMQSISSGSMGADLADIDNDGWPDLFVTEMLPRDHARLKTIGLFEDWNRYQYNVVNDYHHQFARNMLQLNSGGNAFHEIGRLAGVEASDWSWGALVFDMDNDGRKDIFVANGIYQDLTNQDFLQFVSNEEFVKSVLSRNAVDYKKLTDAIPSTPISNYAFRNSGDLSFRDATTEWGLGKPGFSNGCAYGDLDNDGDLDLIINNVNMPSFVYRNEADNLHPGHRYIKVVLSGSDMNSSAIGASITAEAGGRIFYVEQMPTRGFESSVDHRVNIGLGLIDRVDRITVNWPDGAVTILDSVAANQTLVLRHADATASDPALETATSVETVLMKQEAVPKISFTHDESEFVDFDRDHLVFHMMSTEGPRLAKGDINGDGREDIFIGGAKGQASVLLIQNQAGEFVPSNQALFERDKLSEDTGSLFFDADNDGDLDVYVCSGGNEFLPGSAALADRLYINDGNGILKRSEQPLPSPSVHESTSVVAAGDFDGDGDMDLFLGARLVALQYGLPASGYILTNDGHGHFTDRTNEVAPGLNTIGMITDAVWVDIDGDGDPDLAVVGEYMPIKIFRNDSGVLVDVSEAAGMRDTHGWWNRIEAADLDLDGDIDFVVGNHGLNSKFKASREKPVSMYVGDFDQNGMLEQIVCVFHGDKSFPMVLRHDLVGQIPSLKKKYLKYESYKDEMLADIFSERELEHALCLQAFELRSSILLNDGRGKFEMRSLPLQAQFSPVYGIEVADIDGDRMPDIIVGGNLFGVKPQAGRYDASHGLLLKGDTRGNFTPVPHSRSGILITGEVRDIILTTDRKGPLLIFSRNNDSVLTYRFRE